MIAALVACLGLWRSSGGPAASEIGAEARVIWPPSPSPSPTPRSGGGPSAPAPPRAL